MLTSSMSCCRNRNPFKARFSGCKDSLDTRPAKGNADQIKVNDLELDNNTLYSAILNNMAEAMIATDLKGRVTMLNPAAEALTGWVQADATGKDVPQVFNMINGEPQETVGNFIEKVISRNSTLELANCTLLNAADGTEFQIDGNISPVKNEKGAVSGVALTFRDMTEYRQNENALRESRESYRKLVENSPDLIYRTDQSGNITFISKSVMELSGYTNEEAIGLNMAAEVYLHPNERDQFLFLLTKNGHVQNFEAELKRKDGSTWWASTNAHLVIDTDGNFSGVEGITRDITDIKKVEDALRESEEKFTLITEQSLMGIILFQDSFYKYLNETAARIFEYTVMELMAFEKEEFLKLVHPDDVDFVRDQYRKKQAGEKDVITSYTYRGLTRSGKTRWIELYSATVTYQGKTADLVTLIDRTERREVEQALRDSEEKYRNVVMNAVEAICVVQNSMLKYLNPEAIRFFGYSEQELIQMPVDELVYAEDRQMVSQNRNSREKGGPEEGFNSYRILTKDGDIRWVDSKSVVITWGDLPATLIFLTDITEKKKSNELMIQTEKMMSVGGLAAGMAHELNNPLGGILQGIQNIKRRLSPNLQANQKLAEEYGIDLCQLQLYLEQRGVLSFFDGVIASGKKAAEIIKNMLQFSRKSESKMAPINLTELIDKVLDLAGKDYDLKKKYDFRNIEIGKEFEPNLPLVPCTETEIEQVLLNLLKNAAYAMTEQNKEGKNLLAIRLLRQGLMIRIEVEDNGPGMDEATRKRIFEPFFTTKPVGEGTGLGLSVSYMIITNNHKGTMKVESEPGQGATFIFQLPLGP